MKDKIPDYTKQATGLGNNGVIKELGIQKLFRGIILGPSMSGKNNLVYHILKSSPNIFGHLHIIARNPDQALYRHILKKIPDHVSFYNADSIPPLDAIRREDNDQIQLVIIDDFSNDQILQKRVFSHFFTRGRHLKLSTLFLAHSYFAVDKMIRLNSEYVMILKANSLRDLRMIVKDFNIAGIDNEKMLKAYRNATDEKGQVLLVDSLRSELRYNFKEVVDPNSL